MFKHANTLAPQDRVRCKPVEGKVAAVQGSGTVTPSEVAEGQVQVHWDDGSFSTHAITELDPA